MENFEEINVSDESADIPQDAEPIAEPAVETVAEPAAETVYRGTGAGRKESPYANSPYEMNRPYQNEYRYQPQTQPPEKPKKEKKARKGVWKSILAVALAIALVAGSCSFIAACVNEYWEERNEDTVEMLMEEIEDLRKQINNMPGGTITAGSVAEGEGLTPGQLYRLCVDSVVAISSTIQSTGYYGNTGV